MYYMLGRYEEALEVWSRALDMEKNSAEIDNLQYHINLARHRLGDDTMAMPALEPALSTSPAVAPARAAPRAHKSVSSDDLERLFQKGMDHYTRGENLQATAMFMRILRVDPSNAKALKALELLQKKAPGGPVP
jgi:tetratricopeptide (TPR) repeat protein